ncbi:MAG TPA: helix-turn-helix domain-containing protein [Pyrinomonadaceae bacterium]
MSRFLTKILNEPPGGRQKTEESTVSPSTLDGPSNKTDLFNLDRPATTDSPSILDSPAAEDSLSTGQPPPLPVDSPSTLDSPSTRVSPSILDRPILLDAIPEVRGHTQLPHRYTDHLPRWLSADEQAVYVQLYRLSWGWGNEVCFISNPKLSERSGVPETSMRRAVKKLISKGLIEKTERRFGGAEQGIEYRVSILDRLATQDRASNKSSLSNMAPNKERVLKENFKADASQCPDCMGTGFYYPEGTAKGVKRCEHRKLQ